MNSQSKVSILIPTFNRENIIGETIESALAQTYQNIEVIIVDNNSTDDTWSVIQSYAKSDDRIKVFRNEKNIGPVRNWKRCIDEASGEYGKILWSDDLITPDFIEKTLSYLKDDSEAGFVFTSVKIFSDTNEAVVFDFDKTGVYENKRFVDATLFNTEKFPVSPGCALFYMSDLKKSLLINVPNRIDSDFSMHAIGNDLLIYLLTAREYTKFGFVNEPLSLFRSHGDSISVASNKSRLYLLYAVAKAYYIETYGTPEMIRRYNGILKMLLLVYKKNNVDLHSISDFYMKNRGYKIDYLFMVSWAIKRVLHKLIK